MPRVVRRAVATAFAFDLTPWKNGVFQKARSDIRQSGCLATSRSERARPMPVKIGTKRINSDVPARRSGCPPRAKTLFDAVSNQEIFAEAIAAFYPDGRTVRLWKFWKRPDPDSDRITETGKKPSSKAMTPCSCYLKEEATMLSTRSHPHTFAERLADHKARLEKKAARSNARVAEILGLSSSEVKSLWRRRAV